VLQAQCAVATVVVWWFDYSSVLKLFKNCDGLF
jgi:hypothetical protein